MSSLRPRFRLIFLLLVIGMVALILLPVSYYVRSRQEMPDFTEEATLDLGSYAPDSSVLYQRMLNNPAIRDLSSFRKSSNPEGWLRSHLLLEKSKDVGSLYICAVGKRETIGRDELRQLMSAAVEIIRRDAKTTHNSFSQISSTGASRF